MYNLLKQIRVAFIGSPDTGKSTIIKNIIESLTGKILSPDTLMNEVHYSDGRDPDGNPDTRTIKCAKIMFKYGEYEYCFYDAPGHIEYIEQIKQAVSSADIIVMLTNAKTPEISKEYFSNLCNKGILNKIKHYFEYSSHSGINDISQFKYDVEKPGFKEFAKSFINLIYKLVHNKAVQTHDIEAEAIDLIKSIVKKDNKNIMFFSAGKDSCVGLKLLELANCLQYTSVYMPFSRI